MSRAQNLAPPAPLPETLKLLQTLGAARLVSGRGEQDISSRETLDEVEWLKEQFRPGTYWARRTDLGPTDEEQNLRNPKNAAIPNF